ncbi:MAG: hypothetical protein JHC95_07460 [Solirubrobacteraceae bacterium]|nr:hypothetical protein [Solirubrobacteraceae bacterium]
MRSSKMIAVACMLAAAGPATAQAAGWTPVTPAGSNTNEPGLARTADGVLHVAYATQQGGERIEHRAIGANGTSLTAPVTVAALTTVNPRVALVREAGGGLRAFFAGLAGGDPDGFLRTATADTGGAAWTPAAPASKATQPGVSPVYAATGISAVVGTDGVPVSIWGDSNGTGDGFHIGVDPNAPDTLLGGTCCDLDPNVAVDAGNGELVAAWTFLGGGEYQVGPLGLATSTPPGGLAPTTQDRAPLTGRIGAPGVFLGGLAGGKPALWRVGTPSIRKVPAVSDAQHVTIAAAPGGRLWLAWLDDGNLIATRTNPAGTTFGALQSVKLPAGSSFRTAGEASTGPLDAFVLAGSTPRWQHRRLLPALTMNAPLLVKRGKKLAVKVTDAGDALGGVKVKAKLGGSSISATTTSGGKVKLQIPAGTSATSAKVTATKTGYAPASAVVRITR